MREAWIQQQFATALPAAAPVAFGRARPPFSLAVDLRENWFSKDWWRGATTLAALILWALMLGPGLDPLPAGTAALPTPQEQQWDATGVGSIADGSPTGIRMAANNRVETIAEAPERASIDLYATVGRDGLARSLVRVGATTGDAIQAQSLVRGEGGRVIPGTIVSLTLGRKGYAGQRPIERLQLRAGLDMRMAIARGETGLTLTRVPIAVDRTPVRLRGRAGDGLYWALRAAGASSQTAAAYLKALATQIDVGEVTPEDRFDMVLANVRSADGDSHPGPLLYAGLERAGQRSLQLVAWSIGGKVSWVDAATAGQATQPSDAMIWPVNARITSTFGLRYHPILHFSRMHRGIDFGAGVGTLIHAAADGQVTRAGWAGGYGRQVRIAHGGGMTTSYSHMSRLAVEPGTFVRQGDLIGYVGSSGLSTGPHLHYEVLRNGVAVNPMGVRFAAAPTVDPAMTDAIKARLKALLAVGTKA
jgi:murein DD-endopeptidase MepM/ murein hydrolase activator NlpD